MLGKSQMEMNGQRFPDDCTGLARAVYAAHGVDLLADGGQSGDNGVTAIYRYARHHGTIHSDAPRAGDLVFFKETYDRNHDGRENDGLTHIGVVESVAADGTVSVIHRVARGVIRYHMNIARPLAQRDPTTGHILNDYLRDGHGKRSKLAGELFAGYATIASR